MKKRTAKEWGELAGAVTGAWLLLMVIVVVTVLVGRWLF